MSKLNIKKFNTDGVKPHRIYLIVGKRGTGKSVLLMDLLSKMKDNFDIGVLCTPTQSTQDLFKDVVPDTMIYSDFDPQILGKLIDLQKHRSRNKKKMYNIFVVLDDCAYDKNLFGSKCVHMRDLFFNGRHYRITAFICLQYMLDIPPAMRTNVDFLFALREPIIANQNRLWSNYFGIINNFESFQTVFNSCTQNYECLVSDNTATGTNLIENCVFWYKACSDVEKFRLCADWVWREHSRFEKRPGDAPTQVDSAALTNTSKQVISDVNKIQ